MSASEDSEVDENLDSSSSFTSYQPAQVQSLAPALDQSSNSSQSDSQSELLADVDNDHDSDDSFILPSNDQQDLAAERARYQEQPDDLADPFAAEQSYYTRPNRYYGPASTWRSWTKGDRDVAESLAEDRARDLSIHLYNAHALRLQAHKLKATASRKRRRGTSETDDNQADIFEIPKVWTAWPMPPHEVQRGPFNPVDSRPSKELEECLISTTTKAARERWNSRDWQEEEIMQQASTEEPGGQIAATSSLVDSKESAEFASQVSSNDESFPDIPDDASNNDLYGIDPSAKPTILADDDKARHLLLPSTRQIISKLDHLLMGLHRARHAYAEPVLAVDDDMKASSATDGEPQSSGSSKKRHQYSRAQRASSVSTVATDASIASSALGRKKGVWKEGSKPYNRKFKGLELRDWSDVLGMASLTGWDEDVVARASKKCAELFGENMLFRRFHEGEHEEKPYFTEAFATGDEPPDDGETDGSRASRAGKTEDDENANMGEETGLKYPCPIDSCPRHKMPFNTPGNLTQHMSRHHAALEDPDDKENVIDATLRDRKQVFCPVQTCLKSRQPFTKGSKLYLHVRKMHPEVNVEDLKKLESQRRGETRGRWTGDKRKKNPYERG
jgi:hypothetical protein